MLKLKRYGVITVLAATLAVPASASAQGQDLRNPDRRTPVTQTQQKQDLRNADRRAPAAPAPVQDLRNADRRGPATVEPVAPQAPAITTIELPSEGFDWGDAGIGAAGGIAVLAMLAGLGLAATHRRRGSRVTA